MPAERGAFFSGVRTPGRLSLWKNCLIIGTGVGGSGGRSDELVAIGPWAGRQLGLAVDLGTTKIASYLVDLDSGRTVAAQAVMNPQIAYGEDVMARLDRAIRQPNGAAKLRELAVEALNRLAHDLCGEAGAHPR